MAYSRYFCRRIGKESERRLDFLENTPFPSRLGIMHARARGYRTNYALLYFQKLLTVLRYSILTRELPLRENRNA